MEADTGEAPEDDATARPQMEKDNLAARLLFVCTTVLTKHVQRFVEDGEPHKALGAFRSVLKRLERFVALDGDPLSLHSLGAGPPTKHVRPHVPQAPAVASVLRSLFVRCRVTPEPLGCNSCQRGATARAVSSKAWIFSDTG